MSVLMVALAATAFLLSPGVHAAYEFPTTPGASFPAPKCFRKSSSNHVPNADEIKTVSATLAYDLLSYYKGNLTGHTLGILPGPPPDGDHYWWEAGAMWGAMMDYWHYTGDESYNEVIIEAMVHQAGHNRDFMPKNWTASLGNDDQGFWGMTAMLGAELNFPNPPETEPQWLALAQAVWNTQAAPDRHDETCGGGLRWQIPLSNNGYNYKNSISNGCFFNMGARLARYLENDTYAEWADRTWNWMVGVGYIDDDYNVYDGGHVEYNCTDINLAQFSYNVAVFAQGVAYLYNYVCCTSPVPKVGLVHGLLTLDAQ